MTGKISEDDDVAITDTMKFASEDGGENKAPLATRFKAYLKTYFDTLYLAASATAAAATKLATARSIDGQSFDGSADITVIAPGTHAATGKTTPVDSDEVPLVDSAASNALKKLTWANLKTALKTYFDTLYTSVYSGGTVTPALTFGGGNTGITYAAGNTGTYRKLGPFTLVMASLRLSNKGSSTGNSAITLTGMPASDGSSKAGGNIAFYSGMSGLSGAILLGLNVAAADTLYVSQSAATGSAALTDTSFTNSSRIDFSLLFIG